MISIDPGVEYFAWAWFDDKVLGACGVVLNTQPLSRPWSSASSSKALVIESQYIDRDSPARTDDVIRLAQAAGRIAANYPEAVWYLPAQWKGGVPKAVHQKRILAALSDKEKALLKNMNKGTLKQVLDAIGLGLYHLGRL